MSEHKSYDKDGLRLRVNVTEIDPSDPLPVFGWASAKAKEARGAAVISGSATPEGASLLCVFAPDALAAGIWRVQVRACATEAEARVVFDEDITLFRAL